MANVSFCWRLDGGSFVGPAEQGDFEVIPSIGDRYVLATADEDPDAVEVVERYLVSDGDLGDIWHLIVKPIELRLEIIKALGLSGSDTKRRWDDFDRKGAERIAEANGRLDAARREARERREKGRKK